LSETQKREFKVKVPKCYLSALKGVLSLRQLGGRLRGSHPLKKA